jgi:predicted Fe-Mo cluster-binding NifX family protein
MHIAVTVWGERISPVFDAAQWLLLIESDGGKICSQQKRPCRPVELFRFLQLLEEAQVEVLICGALCHEPAAFIESRGIRVFSFLTGEAMTVVDDMLGGRDLSVYTMPGCRRRMERCRQLHDTKNNLAGFPRQQYRRQLDDEVSFADSLGQQQNGNTE